MSKVIKFLNSWEGAYSVGAAVALFAVALCVFDERTERRIRGRNYRKGFEDGVKFGKAGFARDSRCFDTEFDMFYDSHDMMWQAQPKRLSDDAYFDDLYHKNILDNYGAKEPKNDDFEASENNHGTKDGSSCTIENSEPEKSDYGTEEPKNDTPTKS